MREDELQVRISKILGVSLEKIQRTTWVTIMEDLVEKIEKNERAITRKELYAQYREVCVVSYRTFVRRLEMGMPAYKAATTPPAPTRPKG